MGMTICNTNEFVQSRFLDGVLIVRYIDKMATDGRGGVVDGETAMIASHIGPGLKSQPGCHFVSRFFVQIHTNEFIQLLYKLYSKNSYMVWFLYQFIHFLYKL